MIDITYKPVPADSFTRATSKEITADLTARGVLFTCYYFRRIDAPTSSYEAVYVPHQSRIHFAARAGSDVWENDGWHRSSGNPERDMALWLSGQLQPE